MCQLESSGKWPDEVSAIEKIKTAFYVHIAKSLKDKKAMIASPTEGFLDILKVCTRVCNGNKLSCDMMGVRVGCIRL